LKTKDYKWTTCN